MKKTDLFFAFILLPVDIAMIIVGFVLAYYFRIDLEVVPAFSDIGLLEYLRYCLYLIPFWIILFALNGLYKIKITSSIFSEFYRILSASSTAILLLVVGIFLTRSLFFSRLILVFTWIFSILTISFGRVIIKIIQRYLVRFGIGRREVLLIGDNKTSRKIMQNLFGMRYAGYRVLGILDEKSKENYPELPLTGNISSLEEIIKKNTIDDVIVTDLNLSRSDFIKVMQTCCDHNISFRYIPDALSLMTVNVSAELIGGIPALTLKSVPLDGWGRITKRIMDIALSLFFAIVGLPLFALIMVIQKFTSSGPIFYAQERIGRDGKSFVCYKFRSMYWKKCDKKLGGIKWTTAKDETERITPFGRFLRKTNLDELPQLWNVFLGQMSFVGPRPEQPNFVEKFEKEIPDYFKRHHVKTGLTGWAQVNGLKGDTSIEERVRYDMYYIENWSLLFDLKIIAKTFLLVIKESLGGKYEYRSRS